MNWFTLPWRRLSGQPRSPQAARSHHRVCLSLEGLEDRTVPTLFAVVPLALPENGGQFHTLQGAINASANLGDTIQIEPGSVPGSGSTGAKTLTIQGDPNFGPASLPQLGVLLLQSDGNVLNNLNLGSVGFDNGATGQFIHNCFAVNISEANGPLLNGGNVISFNQISNTVVMGSGGITFPGAVNDVISNNAFVNNTGSVVLLAIAHDNGAIITGNTFSDPFSSVRGIQVEESTNVVVSNNTIVLLGVGNQGIQIDNPEFDSGVFVTNNRIDTASAGIGITTLKTAAHGINVVLSGNDLVQNQVGLDVEGDGTTAGTVDAGGGPLGSRGGNDFHGFVSTLNGFAAIHTANGPLGTVSANFNIFSVPNANSVITALGEAVDASNELTADQGFVQTLYNDFLHRSGELVELNNWVTQLPALGRFGVSTTIVHSGEADARLVDRLYVKLLARDATAAERTAGVTSLTSGGTLESVAAGILATPEFLTRSATITPAPADTNSNFVYALYILVLNRVPDPSEIGGWTSAVATSGRLAVANGFLHSGEFRFYGVRAMYFSDSAFGGWAFFDIFPNLLHRQLAPNNSEPPIWSNSSLDLISIEAAIASSGEFYALG